MMSMLSNNPAMSGAVQSVMGAAAATTPPAQQQQGQAPPYIRQQPQSQQPPAPPAHIFQVRDYGAPPASSGSSYDPATAREFQINENQRKQLEERLKQQVQETEFVREQAKAAAAVRTLPTDDTEELRLLMDNLVTKHVDESAAAPATDAPAAAETARPASLTVQMPAPTARRGGARGGRGGRRGGG